MICMTTSTGLTHRDRFRQDFRPQHEIRPSARPDEGPIVEQQHAVGMVRDSRRILFDQQNCPAATLEREDQLVDLIDNDGSEAERRFVQHQKAAACHQATPYGHHPALASRQRTRELAAALGELRQKRQHEVEAIGGAHAGGRQIGPHQEVLDHAHAGKEPVALRNVNHAASNDRIGTKSR